MKATAEHNQRMAQLTFASVYPHVSFNLNNMKSLLPILILTFSLLEYDNSYGQNRSDSIVINRSSIFIELLGNAPQIS